MSKSKFCESLPESKFCGDAQHRSKIEILRSPKDVEKCVEKSNTSKKIKLIKKEPRIETVDEDAATATTPININLLCIAICADNTQCTRVKKRGSLLCCTHAKSGTTNTNNMSAIDVWVEEVNGIAYYLDKNGNVYDTEGVLENRLNPSIIGHYSKKTENISIEFI